MVLNLHILFFFYSVVLRYYLQHIIRCSNLLKFLVRTLMLVIQVSFYQFFFLKLIRKCMTSLYFPKWLKRSQPIWLLLTCLVLVILKMWFWRTVSRISLKYWLLFERILPSRFLQRLICPSCVVFESYVILLESFLSKY